MIAASGERQQFVVPAASFGNVRNVAPQGCPPRWGVTRPRAAVTAGRRWSPPSATAGAWAAAAPSTPAFWCPPRTAHWPPGFQSTPAMRSALRSACARPAPASRAKAPGPADHGEPVGHAGRALVHEPVGHLADGRLSRPGAGGAGAAPGCQDLAQREPDLHRRRVLVLPDPGRLFRSLYHQPPVPPGRQAQPRDAVLEPELRPHLGQPVHGQDLSTGTRARSENQYFLTLSFPWQRQRQHLCQQVRQ